MDIIGKLLIRPDTGPDIGTRHVLRCMSLGKAWARLGGKVDFAVSDLLPVTLQRRIQQEGFERHDVQQSTNPVEETRAVNQLIEVNCPTWLVLDGHRFEDSYQSGLQLGNTRLMCINDRQQNTHRRIHAVLNHLLRSTADDTNANAMSGSKYAIVPEDSQTKPNVKRIPAMAKRILIAFDGLDSADMTSMSLAAINDIRSCSFSTDVLLDRCNQHNDKIQKLSTESPHSIRLHYNSDRITALIDRMDLAIAAGGSNCFEMAYHGVPAIVFAINESQRKLTASLVNGSAAILGDSKMDKAELSRLLRSTVRNQSLRKQLSDGGRNLIDGEGADRVARRLAVKPFRVRPARIEDAKLLHMWKNDPEVRATCFQQECVPFDIHFEWLDAKLRSVQSDVRIISDRNSIPVGQISLDYNRDFTQAELNINLVPSLRGRGLGTAFIELACQNAAAANPQLQIIANIKTANSMSQAAFRKAGFKPVSTTTINGQVGLQFMYEEDEFRNREFDNALPRMRMAS